MHLKNPTAELTQPQQQLQPDPDIDAWNQRGMQMNEFRPWCISCTPWQDWIHYATRGYSRQTPRYRS